MYNDDYVWWDPKDICEDIEIAARKWADYYIDEEWEQAYMDNEIDIQSIENAYYDGFVAGVMWEKEEK